MRILTLSPDELKLVQTFYYVSKEMVWMLICCPTLSFCVVKFALDRWVNAIFCKFYWCVTEIRFIWSVVVLHIKKHVLLSMLLQPYEMIDLIWFDLIWFIVLNATFSYIMATSFSGRGSRSTRREPPTMGKQLV
jgi:hypothetical protein